MVEQVVSMVCCCQVKCALWLVAINELSWSRIK